MTERATEIRAVKPEIARIVLINHPAAESLAEACADELRGSRLGKPVIQHLSKPGGREPNAEMLRGVLEPGDAVGVVAGDGTFRDIAASTRDTPVTSVAGGNARDIGRALHRRMNLRPSRIFSESVAVPAYGLECTVAVEGERTVHQAISYIGCGKSADATYKINSPSYRQGMPIVKDLRISLGILSSGYSFEAVDNDGEERILSDLTFVKGSRMAKLARFPIKHWDRYFQVMPVEDRRLAGCITASRLLIGRAVSSNHIEPYTFTPQTAVNMHFDGEPVGIPPHSEVSIGLADDTYTVLTTRLNTHNDLQ